MEEESLQGHASETEGASEEEMRLGKASVAVARRNARVFDLSGVHRARRGKQVNEGKVQHACGSQATFLAVSVRRP